jgi:hypothetical protein
MDIRSIRPPRTRAFTLLEVALIVAIIGMMLMMIVGYLLAPKDKGALPPVTETPPLIESTPAPLPVPAPVAVPAATPVPVQAAPVPAEPAPAPATPVPVPATPVPTATPATPAQTIELSPQSTPVFR